MSLPQWTDVYGNDGSRIVKLIDNNAPLLPGKSIAR
jgi:hypothetical protein